MVWGIHIISEKPVNIPKYIFLSMLISILTFFVRWLPIYFGVHMIINIILTISIMVIIKIPLIKSINSTLLVYFILSLSEFLNIVILDLLNINMNIEFSNPFIKCLSGMPSLIILLIFIIILNYFLKTKGGMDNVPN